MSKFDRHKKKGDSYYIYPHKHCLECGRMIDESLNYCSGCYKLMKEKKEKKRFRKKKSSDDSSSENKSNNKS
ncbi:MAG: hypothetical protein ACFFAN_08080 [Promethearchaeota archaeon]